MTEWNIFLTMLVSNMLAFGNAAVSLSLLQRAFVTETHALTADQMLYAYALGRVTPGQGNLYIAAVGYMLSGLPGALIALTAMILPGYLILPMWHAYSALSRIRAISRFTRGLIGTAVGLIFATLYNLGQRSLTGLIPIMVFAIVIVLMRLKRLPTPLNLAIAVGSGVAVYVASGQI